MCCMLKRVLFVCTRKRAYAPRARARQRRRNGSETCSEFEPAAASERERVRGTQTMRKEEKQQPSENSERQLGVYVCVCVPVCVRAPLQASTVRHQYIYFVSSQCVHLLETSSVIFVQLYCMLFVQPSFYCAELGLRSTHRCAPISLERLVFERKLREGRFGVVRWTATPQHEASLHCTCDAPNKAHHTPSQRFLRARKRAHFHWNTCDVYTLRMG